MYDWKGSQEYEVVEGPVSNPRSVSGATRLTLDGRTVRVAGTAVATSVREGECIRALLRKPEDGSVPVVIAFQRCGDPAVEYCGPKVTVHFAIIAAVLLVTGLYYGVWWLVCLGAPVVVLRLLFSMQETSSLRRFEAYCRTSPVGSLRL